MYSICLPFVWDTPLVDKVTSLPPTQRLNPPGTPPTLSGYLNLETSE